MHTAPVERCKVLTNIINFTVIKLNHIAPVASSNVLIKYIKFYGGDYPENGIRMTMKSSLLSEKLKAIKNPVCAIKVLSVVNKTTFYHICFLRNRVLCEIIHN